VLLPQHLPATTAPWRGCICKPAPVRVHGGFRIATDTEMLAREVSSFPHDWRTVARKHLIFGREREPLGECLSHEDAIEGVLVQVG
jgi:hypothetical protein